MVRNFISLSFLVLIGAVAESRSWTSSAGSEIQAELISHEGESVLLKTNEGREISLKLSQLSSQDQDYLASLKSQSEKDPKETVPNKRGSEKKELPDWENWNTPWPKLVKTSQDFDIEEVPGDGEFETHEYVYQSPHFIFYSDAQLTKSLVKKFAWYFESSHNYLSQLPLSMARTQEEERHKIVLYEHESEYYRNGGPAGSAGVYMGRIDTILVPFKSVGMKKMGSRYTVDRETSNKTLSHEIVHSFTDWPYYAEGARGWFTEGLAEYVALTPYRSGNFMASKAQGDIEQYVTNFSDFGRGRNLGTEIHVGSLKEFMLMPYERFTSNANHCYGVGALLVTYFCDIERDTELQNIQNFLKALKDSKKKDEALAVLLNGRTFKELENSIQKAWRGKGVTLDFE